MRFLLLLIFASSYIFGIDFDALESIKNEKTNSTSSLTNFDTSRAQKVTSQEKTRETWLQKKTEKFIDETAEYMRNNPTVTTASSSGAKTMTSTSTSGSSKSINRSKSNGVKKFYVSSKGAKGQDLYVIKCHNGRSISGVWKKSSALWMSGATSFGHHGQSIDQVARDYCK